ncbi:MAG: rhodanese-like domain-containing protein [Phycisphaerales bacterium]
MGKKMQHRSRNDRYATLLGVAGLILMTLVAGGCTKSNISDRKIDYIDLTRAVDLYEKQQKDGDVAMFIDTRKPEQFASGHIPGARNMRTPDIDLRYGADKSLEKYKHLIIYGQNPGQANVHAMAKRMIEAGYNGFAKRRVKVYLGGWAEWEITGLPITEEAQTESDE